MFIVNVDESKRSIIIIDGQLSFRDNLVRWILDFGRGRFILKNIPKYLKATCDFC